MAGHGGSSGSGGGQRLNKRRSIRPVYSTNGTLLHSMDISQASEHTMALSICMYTLCATTVLVRAPLRVCIEDIRAGPISAPYSTRSRAPLSWMVLPLPWRSYTSTKSMRILSWNAAVIVTRYTKLSSAQGLTSSKQLARKTPSK